MGIISPLVVGGWGHVDVRTYAMGGEAHSKRPFAYDGSKGRGGSNFRHLGTYVLNE